MPQLDIFMFSSQSLFIFLFLIGYLLFIRYLIPILAFELKLKELLPLYYLNWFDQNNKKLYSSYSFVELFLLHKVKIILKGFVPYLKYIPISYTGIYYQDLLYLRSRYNKRVYNIKF